MLNPVMTKAISVFCTFLLVIMPVLAHADSPSEATLTAGKVTQLHEGQSAPFAGVLLSNDSAARLYGDLKFTEKECQLRLDRELKLNTAQLMVQLDALKLRFDVETTRSESLLSIKNERIEFLEKNWTVPAWYESGEFWFALGVAGGILVTISAGYALGQAAK
jgi:hypothetical protein